jgi:hypothetical protein
MGGGIGGGVGGGEGGSKGGSEGGGDEGGGGVFAAIVSSTHRRTRIEPKATSMEPSTRVHGPMATAIARRRRRAACGSARMNQTRTRRRRAPVTAVGTSSSASTALTPWRLLRVQRCACCGIRWFLQLSSRPRAKLVELGRCAREYQTGVEGPPNGLVGKDSTAHARTWLEGLRRSTTRGLCPLSSLSCNRGRFGARTLEPRMQTIANLEFREQNVAMLFRAPLMGE